ncbi:hypothetical protein ACFL31_02110 [Candidatus Margulisiibacteriota bacterium]
MTKTGQANPLDFFRTHNLVVGFRHLLSRQSQAKLLLGRATLDQSGHDLIAQMRLGIPPELFRVMEAEKYFLRFRLALAVSPWSELVVAPLAPFSRSQFVDKQAPEMSVPVGYSLIEDASGLAFAVEPQPGLPAGLNFVVSDRLGIKAGVASLDLELQFPAAASTITDKHKQSSAGWNQDQHEIEDFITGLRPALIVELRSAHNQLMDFWKISDPKHFKFEENEKAPVPGRGSQSDILIKTQEIERIGQEALAEVLDPYHDQEHLPQRIKDLLRSLVGLLRKPISFHGLSFPFCPEQDRGKIAYATLYNQCSAAFSQGAAEGISFMRVNSTAFQNELKIHLNFAPAELPPALKAIFVAIYSSDELYYCLDSLKVYQGSHRRYGQMANIVIYPRRAGGFSKTANNMQTATRLLRPILQGLDLQPVDQVPRFSWQPDTDNLSWLSIVQMGGSVKETLQRHELLPEYCDPAVNSAFLLADSQELQRRFAL